MLIVKKFGGSSVADKECIFRVAERCAEDYKSGHDVIVVLSAMGDTTDDLIAKAKEINPNPSKRELDMLLTTGEQISVSLMAMAFHKLGIPAVSLNAFQVKMHSTSTYGNARFKKVESERILHELGYRKIVIVTGFQGVNKYEDYATMGRGGSDTTAVAIAAALGADACEIYTDVDGVYTADPRIVPSARKLKEISYDEMQELASMGANVLHNRSVEMAKKYGVQLVVRSSMNREEGTVVKKVESERILHELGYRKIVIVTGFQGVNKYEDYATMGRGGSDTTAVAIAAALGADACEIYTDVDGVYTADPRIVPSARKLKEISYDEMQELASMGANVLHNRSVEMAKKYGVQLVVRSSMNREEGTVVKEVVKVEKLLISGVASDKNTARISVIGIEDKPGTAFKIFNTLAKKNINVDIILQSVGRDGTKDISFTVAEDDLQDTLAILEENKEALTIQEINSQESVAKISIVGAGMMSNPGVAAKMFEALTNARVNIHMISTSEVRITVLINESDVERAINAVHERFGLGE